MNLAISNGRTASDDILHPTVGKRNVELAAVTGVVVTSANERSLVLFRVRKVNEQKTYREQIIQQSMVNTLT